MLSERFVISDAQWALMEPHYFGKKSAPVARAGTAVFSWRRFVDCPNRCPMA